jgi:hypothetical protein
MDPIRRRGYSVLALPELGGLPRAGPWHTLPMNLQSGNAGPPPSILWTDPAGTVLIISTGAPLARRSAKLGIVRDGTFTPLRAQGTAKTGTAAW